MTIPFMRFADTHVHLHFPDFDADRLAVIERAKAAGVEILVNVGTDIKTSEACIELAERYPQMAAVAGFHPHEARHLNGDALRSLEALLAHPRVVGIGEIGLDYFRDHSPRETQNEAFRSLLALYARFKKPLVIHCRDAYRELEAILKEELSPPYDGTIHCYSSGVATMKRFLDLGFHVSFAGHLTYKKNDALREACRACPMDRLLVETDAPYLAPHTRRGGRNEPAFMIETAQLVSELKGVSLEALGHATTANARALFGL
jgi:TatD DNase family protein